MDGVWPEPERSLLHHLMRAVRQGGRALLDLVFPAWCPGCERLNGRHGGVCAPCWQKIRFIEKPYCAVLGLPFAIDRGEGALSPKAIAEPPAFDRLRAVAAFDEIVRDMVHGLKYRDRLDLVPMMARWMARAGAEALAKADLVLPVPLHRRRFFRRRFNQSAELARHIAREAGISYQPDLLLRVRNTSRQVGLGQKGRKRNVAGAFRVRDTARPALAGKRVVLIDDVYTTGATVSAASRALRRAGVADITVLTFAMAIGEPI